MDRHEWIDAVMFSNLPASAKGVCHVLYHHLFGGKESCYPQITRIAEMSGLNRKTVMSALSVLEQKGWVSATKKRGAKTVYTIKSGTENGTASTGTEIGTGTETGTTSSTDIGTTSSSTENGTGTKNGQKGVPVLDKSSTKNGTLNTQLNTEGNTKTYIGDGKTELPTWIDPKDWEDFRAMRKKSKHPITPEGERRALKKLITMREQGHDVQQIIDTTIERSYRGFFAPKDAPKKQTNKDFEGKDYGSTSDPDWLRAAG